MLDIMGVVFILISIVVLLKLVKWVGEKFALSAEHSRKIVHIAMGLTICLFPWIFSSSTVVWILAVLVISLFLAIRFLTRFAALGQVLYGIDRISYGEMYFTLGMAIIFEYASTPLFFILPVLVLTFADAFAAIVGVRYGTLSVTLFKSRRSLEGTATFFALSLLILFAGLSLMGITTAMPLLLVCLAFALLITLVEFVSVYGLDNITIPVATLALLELAL